MVSSQGFESEMTSHVEQQKMILSQELDFEMTLCVEVVVDLVDFDFVATNLVFAEESKVLVEHPCEEAGSSWVDC